jgi:hypothetical protein
MLLSSILQILDQIQAHPPPIEKTDVEPFEKVFESVVEEQSSLMEIGSEIPAAVEFLNPSMPQLTPVFPKQNMEELIRAVTKFEKQEQRVVDVFQ